MNRDYDKEIESFNKSKELLSNLFDNYDELSEEVKDKLRTEIFMFFYEHVEELKADEWEVAGCLFPEISFINLMSYFPEHKELKLKLLERLDKILQLSNNTAKKH